MTKKELEALFQRKYQSKNIDLCRDTMENFMDSLLKILFPALCNKSAKDVQKLEANFEYLAKELKTILLCLQDELHQDFDEGKVSTEFFQEIPRLEDEMNQDAAFILEGDPAAKSLNEVVICYPGFYAIAVYRVAHYFSNAGLPLFARILTEYAHRKTGIDIHPGAKISVPFFIDHGTGVVIGETTEIGKRVKIYQGVTLGATSVEKGMANQKRHPTIEDNCLIYANATILGGSTIIGTGSVIGGNVWLTDSVAHHSRIFYQQ